MKTNGFRSVVRHEKELVCIMQTFANYNLIRSSRQNVFVIQKLLIIFLLYCMDTH